MKGISHFISGVAVATCFPEVVQAAGLGSLLPVLGGFGGILPDTLDFKFARYFERFDLEIDAGLQPDPERIADELAAAMGRAYSGGRPQDVMVHTIRLGADLWREYAVRFDPQDNQVVVRIGPLVNTGQVPLAGTEPGGVVEARRALDMPLVHTYSAEYRINIFSGPSFRFARQGDELHVHFLDWHRRWSHSLTLAVVVAAAVALPLGLLAGWQTGLWGGLLSGLGFAVHVLEDQLGHMGSNLFWPFSKGRAPGLEWLHSGDAIPNFLTVWLSVALILFNLDRFSAAPLFDPAVFLLTAMVVPAVGMGGAYWLQKVRPQARAVSAEARREEEMVAAAEESGAD